MRQHATGSVPGIETPSTLSVAGNRGRRRSPRPEPIATGRRRDRRPGPDVIRWRRDLARLSEPRYLAVTPRKLRAGIAMLAAGYALLGAWRLFAVLAANPSAAIPGSAALGDVPLALSIIGLGIVIQALFKPWDWTAWICFAATSEGLYLPGRRRAVVFVPWFDVVKIENAPTPRGRRCSAVRLTLSLDEQNWARLSRFARVEGEGQIRVFHLPTEFVRTAISGARIEALNPFANSVTGGIDSTPADAALPGH